MDLILILLADEPFLFFILVRACCRPPSTAISTSQHSTAHKPSTNQQSKYVPIRARQHKPAGKVGEDQQAYRRASTQLAYTARCVSTNEDMEVCPAYKNKKFVLTRAFGICKSPVCIYDRGLLRPLHSHFSFSLVSERSGRRKPPTERSVLYLVLYLQL